MSVFERGVRLGRGWVFSAIWLMAPVTESHADNSLWDNVNGGKFEVDTSWFGGVPGENDVARFEITNSNFFQRKYFVDFLTSPNFILNQQLVVEDDDVTFHLHGHRYQLSNPFVAVALGTVPNRSGNLTVTNGDLILPFRADLEIAVVGDHGKGALTVGAGGRIGIHPDVLVGLNGEGKLLIHSGGTVSAQDVTLGVNSGSIGDVTVTGNGSSLSISGDLNMLTGAGSGTLYIETGGAVGVGGDLKLGGNDVLYLKGGRLFVSSLPLLDEIPFVWTSGTLAFDNCFHDLTVPDGGTLSSNGTSRVSGNLTLLPGATTNASMYIIENGFNQLLVEGQVDLDGSNLQLSLAVLDEFLPSSEAKFEIITTSLGISGSFANVANGQRLMTSDGRGSFVVNYGPQSPFDPTSVFISSFLFGTVGDFNGDGAVNALDIDLLAIEADKPQPSNLFYDLNRDGEVTFEVGQPGSPDPSDSDVLIHDILQTRYGDANLDRQVFLGDLNTLATNYRQAGQFGWAQGNFDGSQEAGDAANHRVFLADLNALTTNWRFGAGTAAAIGGAVPEPSGALLALWVAFAALFCRAPR